MNSQFYSRNTRTVVARLSRVGGDRRRRDRESAGAQRRSEPIGFHMHCSTGTTSRIVKRAVLRTQRNEQQEAEESRALPPPPPPQTTAAPALTPQPVAPPIVPAIAAPNYAPPTSLPPPPPPSRQPLDDELVEQLLQVCIEASLFCSSHSAVT